MKDSPEKFAKFLAKVAEQTAMSGAETRIIVQTTERVAKAYGYDSTDVIVSPESISICLHIGEKTYIDVIKNKIIGINMHKLTLLTDLCLRAEHGQISVEEFANELKNLKSSSYHLVTLIFAISAATSAFAIINGGSFKIACVGFFSGFVTILIKQILHKCKLFSMFIFMASGFVATISSILLSKLFSFLLPDVFQFQPEETLLVMIVSILMLVPGFPFVNGILDIFKGYTLMGISRLMTTFIIIASVCVGITVALELVSWSIWQWKL